MISSSNRSIRGFGSRSPKDSVGFFPIKEVFRVVIVVHFKCGPNPLSDYVSYPSTYVA
jgi:hypothetical protein